MRKVKILLLSGRMIRRTIATWESLLCLQTATISMLYLIRSLRKVSNSTCLTALLDDDEEEEKEEPSGAAEAST